MLKPPPGDRRAIGENLAIDVLQGLQWSWWFASEGLDDLAGGSMVVALSSSDSTTSEAKSRLPSIGAKESTESSACTAIGGWSDRQSPWRWPELIG